MAQVNFPLLARVASRKWTFHTPQQINRSRFTGRRKVVGVPGTEKWLCQIAVEPLNTERKARAWRGFVAALRGAENFFRFPVLPSRQTLVDNPTVVAPVAGNRAVALSSSNGIVPGMHMTIIQIDGYQRMVVVVGVVGDQVHFEPFLYLDPLVTSTVEIQFPWAVMSLTSGDNGWDDTNGLVGMMLDMEEAI
jgi:hypothetical protein